MQDRSSLFIHKWKQKKKNNNNVRRDEFNDKEVTSGTRAFLHNSSYWKSSQFLFVLIRARIAEELRKSRLWTF